MPGRVSSVDTARAVHEGIAKFAAESKLARLDVEMGLKQAVQHPDPELAA